ncbi:V-set and immunoglobulin domain-containing protein 1 [Xenopus tropicalis]|uniref:V-set and immunoglobulin domain-containing protein 1 n=1 Tax=Xenopus tropicalis TaxID=8364 RepID=UPI0012F6528B|nr:V-set and immunoglobulin domain-containing protein 1 [Xenopus tropicalis]
MILETPIGATSNSVSSVMEGENITMSVNLNWSRTVSPGFQVLPATFSWFHLNPDPSLLTNGEKSSVISSHYKSELVISSVTASESGIYKCVAENFLGNSTFSFELSVNTGSSSSQLSPGAIAGIVIAALFVVALIPLTVIFILHKTNNNNCALVSTKTLSFDNTPTAPTYENAETPAANNATYDCVIITSEENMAGNNPHESAYQDLQFPHHDLYKTLKKISS